MNTSNRSQSPRRSSLARRTCIGLALTLGLALPAVAAWADEGDDLPPIVGQVTEGSMCDSAAVTLLVSASSKDVWVYTAAGRVQLLDRSLKLFGRTFAQRLLCLARGRQAVREAQAATA